MELERLSQQQFDRFSDFIYAHSGIRVDEKKVSLLSNRLRRRLKAGGFKNFDLYYKFLTSPAGAGELEGFLDEVTTNETFYFRTEQQFDWLKDAFLRQAIADQRAGRRKPILRICSAGCANGAEPYSIAICLAENRFRMPDWSLSVLGIDISEAQLQLARDGRYKPRAVQDVSESRKRRYFQHLRTEDLWQVRSEVKEMVQFKRHNLTSPLRETAFDCIFIRNVLIYFDSSSKRAVLDNLISSLAVGGYLLIGPSEGVYDMLNPLVKAAPLVYQKVAVGDA